MNEWELLSIVGAGETSTVQFKEMLNNMDSIAAEMIALSNAKGGIILFGIEDKTGDILGLNYDRLQETQSKLAMLASDFVKPQIFITTEVVSITKDESIANVLVLHIEEGIAKPYKDRYGAIWLKQGSDKRRLTDNAEQVRLFQQSGLLFADEMSVYGTQYSDISMELVSKYLQKIQGDADALPPDETLCKNLGVIAQDGKITLAGLMFFCVRPQVKKPSFCIKAVSFFGNDIGGQDYRDSRDIEGTIPDMFEQGMSFLTANLHHTQNGQGFNTIGYVEISKIALSELLQNALTHRDYSKESPVRLLIFDNRVEIISPGTLPNGLTVENIKLGNAVMRNPKIASFASKLMEYRGLGSGIIRSLKEQPNIKMLNDVEGGLFRVIIPRCNDN